MSNADDGAERNPFLALAERQMSAPVKARRRAAEKRAASKAQKAAQDENGLQIRAWRAWRRERREALLAGPHGVAAQALLAVLQGLTLASAGELIEAVKRGPWRETDGDVRFEVLCLVDDAITALRERHELPSFDDALPDEPPNAFLQLREVLT